MNCLDEEQELEVNDGQRQMFADSRILLGLVLIVAVISQIAQHYGIGQTWYEFEVATLGYDSFVVSGFLGVAWCFNSVCTLRRNQLLTVLVCCLLEIILWCCRPADWDFFQRLRAVGIGIGVGCFLGLIIYALCGSPGRKELARGFLYVSGFLMLFSPVSLWGHFLVLENCPYTYDVILTQLDGLWGFQPGLAVAQFVLSRYVLAGFIQLVYMELPLLLVWGILLFMQHRERCYNNVVVAFAAIGVAGFALYNVVPAVGLGHLFPDSYPFCDLSSYQGTPYLLNVDGIRNCMPSLHLGWSLCVLLGVMRINSRVRWLALAATGVTMVATLTMCHYLIDLVMSFPLVLTFQALTCQKTANNLKYRALAGGIGILGLALGLGLIRYHYFFLLAHPGLTKLSQITLVTVCLFVEHQLAKHSLPAKD